jgi:hypothetical protein
LIICCLVLCALGGSLEAGSPEAGVRPSVLAGTWYPGDAHELERMVLGYLREASPPEVQGDVRAVIVPHAGYRYSGAVAAHAYKILQGMDISRVILVGPSHRHRFPGISVSLHRAYETPLGEVPVDLALARSLVDSSPEVRFVPEAHAIEHCLEIQLPFLQVVLPGVPVVPVIMGRQDMETCSELASLLAEAAAERPGTLVAASTDLSHYHSYREAEKLDRELIRHVEKADPEGLYRALAQGRCEACGGGAVVAALTAARRAGPCRGLVLEYATSGDVTGERDRVVGYLAAAVLGDQGGD